jgi:phosphate-selective porin
VSRAVPCCAALLAVCLGRTAQAAPEATAEADAFFGFEASGVLMEDFTYLDGISRTGSIASQWQRRRAVLGAQLDFGKRVSLELEGGYGPVASSFEWRDAYVGFDLPRRFELRIGKMKPGFGLAHTTSLKNHVTVERPMATDLLGLERAPGVAFAASVGSARLELGSFRDHDDEGKRIDSVVARALYEHDADVYWHLGVSAGKQDYDRAVYRASTRAETDVMDTFLRTEKITAEQVHYSGADSVFQSGPFALRGEVIATRVISPKEGDRHYAGGYLQGAVFLTADRHEFKDGVGGAVNPAGTYALELVATWSALDALSRNDGFTARTLSVGVNVYYRSWLKVMMEVSGLRVGEGKYAGEDGLTALLRVQYRF